MSRTTFALALAAGLVLAGGCDPKQEPTPPDVKLDTVAVTAPPHPTPPVPPTDAVPDVPKVEPSKGPGWELDQTKHLIPAAPVKGSIAGVEVVPTVQIEGAELTFRAFKPGTPVVERSVKLNLAPVLAAGQPLPRVLGRGWNVKLDTEAGPGTPEVWREVAGRDPHLYPSGYALTLELGPRKDGKVAGKIYLSLADAEKTFLAGTFEAPHSRGHTERPGPDDVPYIGGEVAVTGAAPNAEVRVSYVAFTGSQVLLKELQLPFDPVPEQQARWTRDDEGGNTRASTFVAGDGRGRPFRYEHVRLVPGRYLVSASIVGGPTVWKWVELQAGAALTEDLVLDGTKTGGVEVSVPAGVTGKVHLAPADEPTRPALDFELFVALAAQSVRQTGDIVSGKALVKNLAPGKYEVRAGELRGTIDVVAGKTAELALVPPKSP
jgi:hypothetical protein